MECDTQAMAVYLRSVRTTDAADDAKWTAIHDRNNLTPAEYADAHGIVNAPTGV